MSILLTNNWQKVKRLACLIFGLFYLQPVNALVVLQYHHISDDTPVSTSLSTALFKQHLDYLSAQNFQVISLSKFARLLKSGQRLPDRAVLITFDDGYSSIYEQAFPLLKQKGFPFTVFINTKPIKHQLAGYMNWKQLVEMTEAGATIANHSVSHPYLHQLLPGESESQWHQRVTDEVVMAQTEIEKRIAIPVNEPLVKALAYPYGEFDDKSRTLLKQLGYIAFGQHSGTVGQQVDQQSIPRFPMGGVYGRVDDFILKVNSLPLPLISVSLLDEKGSPLKEHLLADSIDRPKLVIQLKKEYRSLALDCYLSGEGRLTRTLTDRGFVFQPLKALTAGRSRYNCTAASEQKNRFYWFSQPWIKK